MIITFLGTGTSQGVPVISCDCNVCKSSDPRDQRLRTSVMVSSKEVNLVIDTGPDFRQQMLREKVKTLDAVVLTHEHHDHVAGLDDIRAFNYFQKKKMDVYASDRVQKSLHKQFAYVFEEKKYPGIPEISLHTIDNQSFIIKELELTPIAVKHLHLPVFGFRIGGFSYITDANFIPEEEKEKIRGSEVLVLNALRREPHVSHFTLDEAVKLAEELGCKTTYLTHISHQLGKHEEVEKELPENVKLAYDGLQLEIKN